MKRSCLFTLLGLTLAVSAGCGVEVQDQIPAAKPAANAAANQPSEKAAPENEASGTGAIAAAPAPTAEAEAVDDAVRTPATVAEAAKAVNFETFPLLPNAKPPGERTVVGLTYEAPSDVKTAYEFQKKALVERQWKELPQAMVADEYATANYTRDGFIVSLSVTAGSAPKTVTIYLRSHSNVNLRKLPVPPGAKESYAFPITVAYLTDAKKEETAEAVKKLLLADGWAPYGKAGDTMMFKQNAVQLDATVMTSPADSMKTSIGFAASQLSADLPAPPNAEEVQFADSLKQLNLHAPGAPADVAAYYVTELAKAGWKPTTDKPISEKFEQWMIFRNPAKDLLTLTLRDIEGKTRVTLREQSAAEVAEEERRFEEAQAAKKKKEEEEKNKPKPKAVVTLPKDAAGVEKMATQIEFSVATGKGKAAVDAIKKELEAAGWKAEPAVGDATGGQMTFKKDENSVSILYIDPGLIPAEITISGSGVEIEAGEGKE